MEAAIEHAIEHTTPKTPAERPQSALPTITPLMILIEFLLIIVVGLLATSPFTDLNPTTRLSGDESEYITSPGTFAVLALREYGYIPLWQPWTNVGGEPLVQSPLSFIFNPFSMAPSLIYGNEVGIKLSIILTTIMAGLGGWALGRMLGFGSLARVLLAVLCIGRGSMYAQLSPGYYQLALNQAYFPWIAVGVIATMQTRRRWAIVLLALSIALLFFSGMVWHMLPAMVMIVVLVIAHAFSIRRGSKGFAFTVRSRAIRRIIFAGLLTVTLSGVLLFPLWSDRDKIGNVGVNDQPTDIALVARRFFVTSIHNPEDAVSPGAPAYIYFNFVLPAWFAGLILLLSVLVLLRRPPRLWDWRVWSAAVFLFVFCTLWGTDRNPIMDGLEQVIPMFGQWKHVERVLSMASFWLAVLAAIHIDAIWRTLIVDFPWKQIGKRLLSGSWMRRAAAVLLIFFTGQATVQVIQPWAWFAGTAPEPAAEDMCVSWLRRQNPNKELSLWTVSFVSINTYLRNHVRHYRVATDFYAPRPEESTLLPNIYLPDTVPEYALVFADPDAGWATELGYKVMPESPGPYNSESPCVYQRANSLSYAFTIPQPDLDRVTKTNPAELTTPITSYARYPDRVALLVNGNETEPLVVSVQELAYKGWTVEVDGSPARLESIGGYIGVVLPPGNKTYHVYFQFRPSALYLGGWLTILASALSALYLLKADRFIPDGWHRRAQDLFAKATTFLLPRIRKTWHYWTTPMRPPPDDESTD